MSTPRVTVAQVSYGQHAKCSFMKIARYKSGVSAASPGYINVCGRETSLYIQRVAQLPATTPVSRRRQRRRRKMLNVLAFTSPPPKTDTGIFE